MALPTAWQQPSESVTFDRGPSQEGQAKTRRRQGLLPQRVGVTGAEREGVSGCGAVRGASQAVRAVWL